MATALAGFNLINRSEIEGFVRQYRNLPILIETAYPALKRRFGNVRLDLEYVDGSTPKLYAVVHCDEDSGSAYDKLWDFFEQDLNGFDRATFLHFNCRLSFNAQE